MSRWLCYLRGLGIAVGPILPSSVKSSTPNLSPPGDDGCFDTMPRNSESQSTDKWSGLDRWRVLSFAVGWFTSVACSTRKHAARTSFHEDDIADHAEAEINLLPRRSLNGFVQSQSHRNQSLMPCFTLWFRPQCMLCRVSKPEARRRHSIIGFGSSSLTEV